MNEHRGMLFVNANILPSSVEIITDSAEKASTLGKQVIEMHNIWIRSGQECFQSGTGSSPSVR